jgi:hypothetical protein
MKASNPALRETAITSRGLYLAVLILFGIGALQNATEAALPSYDIIYIKAPRQGDDNRIEFPEVTHPINAPIGSELVLLRKDGSEETLVSGGQGAIADPYPSFDGKWIYYSKFHDQRIEAKDRQRPGNPSRAGADIYKLNVETRENIRLTFQEWTPNTGLLDWSGNHLSKDDSGDYYLGYGIFNLGPCPLPNGRIIFTSSRNSFLPNKAFTAPNLQLFVMDDDGKNVELIGHINLGSALHPTVLTDGRVMFSSYEAQGLRDRRIWGLWAIRPDGTQWEPLMSAFTSPSAFHFQTQLSNGDLTVVEYYNQNDNGFGTLLGFNSTPSPELPRFGDPNSSHDSNPSIQRGIWWFNDQHPSHKKPRYKSYSFSPQDLYGLTLFSHGEDNASSYDQNGNWAGKVTQPSGAPNNDVLLVWTPGPANDLNRPTNRPVYDAGIYVIAEGKPIDDPADLVLIKNDPDFNELQPKALVTYKSIYGIEEPHSIVEKENSGLTHPSLPAGTPFGLIGTSSFYRRDSSPARGRSEFDGLDPFNTSQNNASSNWSWQGADSGRYSNADIYAVRILAMEPSTHVGRGPGIGGGHFRGFYNFAQERLRVLGEIPLQKRDEQGQPILDSDGNPDTSFLAKIPADTPFTFQTLDQDGLVLNMSQTWHQVRPGEMRTDCGGCHAHSQLPLDFSLTAAARPEYNIADLALQTPLLSKDPSGGTTTKVHTDQAWDVEYYRDIKPILERSCSGCHSVDGPAEAGLVLDDHSIVDGFENTYNRLARDQKAQYGIPPVIRNKQWRQNNASRYIRKFQSRRSLLVWKLFGRRLDGWENGDHPTESVPGDPATLPAGVNADTADIDYTGTIMPPPNSEYPALSSDEKILFARWIDLGAPISHQDGVRAQIGWFADDLRPTLDISLPRRGVNNEALHQIRFGAFDYYTGVDGTSISITANFEINGNPAGSELRDLFHESEDHIWTLPLDSPVTQIEVGELHVSVKDTSGNITTMDRTFSISTSVQSPEPPTDLAAGVIDWQSIQLNWENLATEVDHFKIYRDGTSIGESSEPSFIDSSPTPGTNHSYEVTAVSMDGIESAPSTPLIVIVPPEPSETDLINPFTDNDLSRWDIIDNGNMAGPSQWLIDGEQMFQLSNIYSLGMDLNRKGTMAIWNSPEAQLWEDYLVTAQLRMTDDDGMGIQFRHLDEANFYRLDLDHLRDFRRLIRVVNGHPTMLAGAYGGPPLEQDFEVAIQVLGDTITILIDGNPAFTEQIRDDTIKRGTVGLYSFANSGAEFLGFVVQPPLSKGSFAPTSPFDLQTLPTDFEAISNQGPLLRITRNHPDLELRWLDPGGHWTIQNSEEFGDNQDWSDVDIEPSLEKGDSMISLSPKEGSIFYRLAPKD